MEGLFINQEIKEVSSGKTLRIIGDLEYMLNETTRGSHANKDRVCISTVQRNPYDYII
jgi:hypothetical protein